MGKQSKFRFFYHFIAHVFILLKAEIMQAVRQIYADLPESIIMPIEFRHRKVEVIILPLDDIGEMQAAQYHVIEINDIAKYSREELHER